MGRKRIKDSLKKVPSSVNLENWIWDTVSQLDSNRSRFFRNLILEKIRADLLRVGLINEKQEISEEIGRLYHKGILSRQSPVLYQGRLPVKSANNEIFIPEYMMKRPISLNIERWLWDLMAKADPNRSRYIRNLFLDKIRRELIEAGRAKENTIIGKLHGDVYKRYFSRKKEKEPA